MADMAATTKCGGRGKTAHSGHDGYMLLLRPAVVETPKRGEAVDYAHCGSSVWTPEVWLYRLRLFRGAALQTRRHVSNGQGREAVMGPR